MTPSATSSHSKGYQGQSPWLVSLQAKKALSIQEKRGMRIAECGMLPADDGPISPRLGCESNGYPHWTRNRGSGLLYGYQ